MVNQGELKRKALLVLIAHPLTAVPFMAGVTMILADLVGLTGNFPLMLFGILAMLGSLGAFLTRFIFKREVVAKEVLEELEAEADKIREEQLDELHQKLSQDRDTRDERLLADLRIIAQGFRESRRVLGEARVLAMLEIYGKVEELFNMCVRNLEQSFLTLEMSRNLRTPAVAKQLTERRDMILDDIAASVTKLGSILTEIGRLNEGDDATEGSRRMRDELDAGIAVARRVDLRMRSLDTSASERTAE